MAKKGVNKDNKNKKTRLSVINDNQLERKKGQGRHIVHEVDTVEYQDRVDQIFKALMEGIRVQEVYAQMLLEDENLSQKQFKGMLTKAYELASTEIQKDRDYVFQLHMNRYEQIFQKSYEMVDSWGRPLDWKTNGQHWPVICAKYINCLKAMKSKEDLIGLHDKQMVLEFTDHKAIVVEKEDPRGPVPGIDITKLNIEEKKELLALIQEARTVPNEGIFRVVIRQTKIEINSDTGDKKQYVKKTNIDNVDTVDIDFEEMPPKVIHRFEDITPVEEKEVIKEMIIDSVKPKVKEAKPVSKDDLLAKFKNQMKAARKSK